LKNIWLKKGHFLQVLEAIMMDNSRKVEMEIFLGKTSLIT
jgi:hypothetical protein